jgi:ADP-heptose:LPS heptosyltransferase
MSGEELHGVHRGRILCIHQGALGDLILALPTIKALRDELQPIWLEIMGHPWVLPLVAGPTYADAITDINKAQMAFLFQEGAPLPEALQAYLGGFDAAFYFGLSATLADNLQRAGIRKTFLLPPFPAGGQHVMDHHFQSLAELGIDALPSPPRIFIREEAKEEAAGFFREKGWNLDEIIALHPGAGSLNKVWPPQRFAALGRILAHGATKLLIIQGPADEEVVAAVVSGLAGVPHLVVHDVPITKLAALLSHASLFIGNDSGCSHLAAALGVLTLALFGPTDPVVWAPRGNKAFWLQGAQRKGNLDTIEVADVLTFLNERMKLRLTPAATQGIPIDMPKATCSHTGGTEGIIFPH